MAQVMMFSNSDSAFVFSSKHYPNVNGLPKTQNSSEFEVNYDVMEVTEEVGLHRAVESGNVELAEELIDNGEDVNQPNEDGSTPLFFGALSGNRQVCELLLTHGANPNIQNLDGATALHAACASGNMEVVNLLLSYGAFAFLQDEEGDCIFHYIVREGHTALLKWFLSNVQFVPTEIKNHDGETPFDLAMEIGEFEMAKLLKQSAKSF